MFKAIGAVIGGFMLFIFLLVFLGALGFLGSAYQLKMYAYFAPRTEAVKRQVFENTPSYQLGNIQTLRKEQFEYIQTKDPSEKAAMRSLILHDAGNVADESTLPVDLQGFLAELRKQQLYSGTN